ncbi:MAG TPA: tetratricopeptide repeat protein [Gemmatimonadaceae bacterium]|nr:tetratricopeptide repeat protein [Gemmatimonadaceae bacterium]
MIRFFSHFPLSPGKVIVAAVALASGVAGCGDRSPASSDSAQTGMPDLNSDAAQMALGLELVNRNDPNKAAEVFRGILQRNPTHYGARFQLAAALDRAGKPAEARAIWIVVLGAAESVKDTVTAQTARMRLAQPDTVSEAGMMSEGLSLLYTRNDPALAAEQFRKVLERNPTHYGANYQIAVALGRSGKSAEARPYWEKVLAMAEKIKDRATADTARARLGR